jgi:transposase-like protein
MMGKPNFSDEFKRDAVAQITERGYPVAEVSQRLGVSQHSLYAWKRQLAKVVSGEASKDAEIRQLKRELARVTEERDILKKPPRISPGMQSEIRLRCRASSPVQGSGDVSVPAHPAQWFLCMAEEPAEPAGSGRCPANRSDPQGLERQRQGLWLPQAAR